MVRPAPGGAEREVSSVNYVCKQYLACAFTI